MARRIGDKRETKSKGHCKLDAEESGAGQRVKNQVDEKVIESVASRVGC